MTCAVVEHLDGSKTHHTNVAKGGIRRKRGEELVILTLIDESIQFVETGVAVMLVDDQWHTRNQLGINA